MTIHLSPPEIIFHNIFVRVNDYAAIKGWRLNELDIEEFVPVENVGGCES